MQISIFVYVCHNPKKSQSNSILNSEKKPEERGDLMTKGITRQTKIKAICHVLISGPNGPVFECKQESSATSETQTVSVVALHLACWAIGEGLHQSIEHDPGNRIPVAT